MVDTVRVFSPMKYVRIAVYFEPKAPGQFLGDLEVNVENGQVLKVQLEGLAIS